MSLLVLTPKNKTILNAETIALIFDSQLPVNFFKLLIQQIQLSNQFSSLLPLLICNIEKTEMF